MFNVIAIDETWGNHRPVSRPKTVDNYADMKALVCHTTDVMVKDLIQHGVEYRYRTTKEIPGHAYAVVVEWCPDGKLVPESGDYVLSEIGLQQAVVIQGHVTDAK